MVVYLNQGGSRGGSRGSSREGSRLVVAVHGGFRPRRMLSVFILGRARGHGGLRPRRKVHGAALRGTPEGSSESSLLRVSRGRPAADRPRGSCKSDEYWTAIENLTEPYIKQVYFSNTI
jgi:hypothetical protein